jgi:stage III sporulation protein SpoIIIAA
MNNQRVIDNLELLLPLLPPTLCQPLQQQAELPELLEVVIDLGRPMEARFSDGSIQEYGAPATMAEISYVVERVGRFDRDNRAGIERTLHRISAIRNRLSEVVGLTCRVGRAVYGTTDIIRDVVETGANILLLGRPGVGKTTKLREIARVLADDFGRRVIVVDTNNEIAGDGDIPHPAIGRARRMQVPDTEEQHDVMIEAVENHMPEVIIIDEIGTAADAFAARTIAERGVQLIGTAHGNSLANLMSNPTLADLIGGIQPVTLSDEEARKRGTQKTVLERQAPPTFDTVIEIRDLAALGIHHQVAATVDAMLLGRSVQSEVREWQADGTVEVLQPEYIEAAPAYESEGREGDEWARGPSEVVRRRSPSAVSRLFVHGLTRRKVERALQELRLPATIINEPGEADYVLSLQAASRGVQNKVPAGVPLETVRSNTYNQIFEAVHNLLTSPESSREEFALREVAEGVQRVQRENCSVELTPQNSYLRRLQHEYAHKHSFRSTSVGKEPRRRVMILPS